MGFLAHLYNWWSNITGLTLGSFLPLHCLEESIGTVGAPGWAIVHTASEQWTLPSRAHRVMIWRSASAFLRIPWENCLRGFALSVMLTHLMTCGFQTHSSAHVGLDGTSNRVNLTLFNNWVKLFKYNLLVFFKDYLIFWERKSARERDKETWHWAWSLMWASISQPWDHDPT